MQLKRGDRVAGRYEIVAVLDLTPAGELYTVRDLQSDRLRGLKCIPMAAARNAKLLENFRRQARVARGLEHPGVVRILDDGEEDGLPYLVTEQIEGRSLREIVSQDGPISSREVLDFARQLFDALAFLHARDVLHRDIRAETLLVAEGGRLKLRDFGMAREVEGQRTVALPTGAPGHMSPEQLMGQPLDGRSDLYSAGIVLYEALTGESPLEGMDVITRVTKPPPQASSKARVEAGLDALITACLQPEPSKRPASAQQALEIIESLPNQPAPEPLPAPNPQPRTQPPPAPLQEPETRHEPRPADATEPQPTPRAEPRPAPVRLPEPPPRPARAGTPLTERMGEQPAKPGVVLDGVIRIVGALVQLAQDGAYHAPLSPETIRFLEGGAVHVDLAPRPQPGQTFIVTNPAYQAPECLFAAPVEPQAVASADIYALGHIAFAWLAGRSTYLSRFPAGIADSKIAWMQWHGDPAQKLPRPADAAPWIPAPLSDLLEAMAAKSATDRPQTYDALLQRLEPIRQAVDETRHIEAADLGEALDNEPASSSFRPKRLLTFLAAAVLLAAFAWLLLRR